MDVTQQNVLVPTTTKGTKTEAIREKEDPFSNTSPSFDEAILAIAASKGEKFGKRNRVDHSCSDLISDPNKSDTRIQ